MKRYTLTLLALGAALLSAGFLLGQGQAKTAAAAPAPATSQKLVKVATLPNAQANREFQSNVQLLQTQRQLAIDLNSKMEQEKDPAKKKELKSQVDAVIAKLNENNQAMQKLYGFSLARNYQLEIEVAHIYMFVTDEEAAQIEKGQKAPPEKKASDKGGKK